MAIRNKIFAGKRYRLYERAATKAAATSAARELRGKTIKVGGRTSKMHARVTKNVRNGYDVWGRAGK